MSVPGSLFLVLGNPTRKRGLSSFVLVVGCLLVAFSSASSQAQESITDKPDVVTPDSKTTTLNKMIDEEAAKLPFLRRKLAQRMLADPDKREEIVERCALKLSENKKLNGMQATFEAEEFTGNTPMALDPEIKKIIMDVLAKLLPILLQLIFKV
jgi:hypothetical protein